MGGVKGVGILPFASLEGQNDSKNSKVRMTAKF